MIISEIVIRLSGADNPPEIKIDGETVAVVKVDYAYETDTEVYGNNEFIIEYVNTREGRNNIKVKGFKSPFTVGGDDD